MHRSRGVVPGLTCAVSEPAKAERSDCLELSVSSLLANSVSFSWELFVEDFDNSCAKFGHS